MFHSINEKDKKSKLSFLEHGFDGENVDFESLLKTDFREYISPDPLGEVSLLIFICLSGRVDLLQSLEGKVPLKFQTMIEKNIFDIFRYVIVNAHLAVLQYLEGKFPELLKDMIEDNYNMAYSMAESAGELAVCQYLEEKLSEWPQDIIEDHYNTNFSSLPLMHGSIYYLALADLNHFFTIDEANNLVKIEVPPILQFFQKANPKKFQEEIKARGYIDLNSPELTEKKVSNPIDRNTFFSGGMEPLSASKSAGDGFSEKQNISRLDHLLP